MIARRGTVFHRWMGRGFAGAALLTAISSFFIQEINQWGQWSWIHLLSIYVIYSTIYGVLAIRRGNVRGHMSAMIPTYLGGFVVAGAFTLLPGRRMFEIFIAPLFDMAFSGDRSVGELAAWAFPVFAGVVALWIYRRTLVRPSRLLSSD